jgi:succinate dehydrogenase hydrophobic anchor subunit
MDAGAGASGDDDAPMSIRTRVTGIILGILLLLVVGFAFLHVALKPVAADKLAPESHYPGPCWVCHLVTSTAEGMDGP